MVQSNRGLERFAIPKALSVACLRRTSDRARLYIPRSPGSQYFFSIILSIEDYFEVARVAISFTVRARRTAPLGACDGHSKAGERLRGGQQQFDSVGKQSYRWRSVRIVPRRS